MASKEDIRKAGLQGTMDHMQIVSKHNFTKNMTETDILEALLHDRSLTTPAEIDDYLHPDPPTLSDLVQASGIKDHDLTTAKDIVLSAINGGEDICIFGDYDADGITSTAILWQTVMGLAKDSHARIMPFIPDRARHGYGLSKAAVEDIMGGHAFAATAYPDFHPSLIVTVDNGIVAHDPVADLVSRGVKVIITDHHQQEDALPPATCIIHSTVTSGAGISWIFSLFLSNENAAVFAMVDLATVGIVADQMPLTGINRRIVIAGLRMLQDTHNIGMRMLLDVAGVGDKPVTVYEINYVIAPRINAVGRLDNPLDALRLLCSRDKEQVQKIAAAVEKHNTDRQQLTEHAITDALNKAVDHAIIVAASSDYHEGIIGLVAGKLAELHNRPALVISIGETVSKGSARSVGDIDITSIMREHRDLLLGVGGHKLAGGFSIETSRIGEFTDRLYAYADKNISQEMLEKKTFVDGVMTISQCTKKLAIAIAQMEPFGMGNPKPRFLIQDMKVLEDRKIGRDGKHRKLVIEQDGTTCDVIWFNGTSSHPMSSISRMICTAEINTWRDKQSLQLNAQYVETN